MYKQIDHEIKKNAKNDQTETIVCTYNQKTYTLLYKLSVQSRQSFMCLKKYERLIKRKQIILSQT